MNRPFDGGTAMEQVTNISLAQQNVDPNDPLTLEQAKERIRALLTNIESNAWDLGDVLNKVEKRGLAFSGGYGKTRTWLEAEIPESKEMASSLYAYANVASRFTKKDVAAWGMTKLGYLYNYDRQVVGRPVEGDPAERELQLVQEDGSTLTKKFRDCTSRDMRRSNQLRKNGEKKGQKEPRATEAAPSEGEAHSFRNSLGVIALGGLALGISGLLPSSFSLFTGWLFLTGLGLLVSGAAVLIRHWRIAWRRLLSGTRGALKLAAAIRSRARKERPTRTQRPATAPEQSPPPPPIEKMAA
jgi:hypothetical protein